MVTLGTTTVELRAYYGVVSFPVVARHVLAPDPVLLLLHLPGTQQIPVLVEHAVPGRSTVETNSGQLGLRKIVVHPAHPIVSSERGRGGKGGVGGG